MSVKQYVNNVCTSLTTFRTDVEDLSTEFQTTVAGQSDLEAVKTEFVNFFDDLHGTAQQLGTELKAAGTPKLANGNKIAKSLRSGISDMRDLIAAAKDDAGELSTADRQAFVSEAEDQSESLGTAFDLLGEGFEDLDQKYDTRKLEAAQDKDPACSTLS